MSRTKLDNIVQDKLQNLDYDFKPEYWDKMENMINASSLSSSTNAAKATIFGSKIFLISISSFILIAGGISSYFIFNNQSEDCKDIINNTTNQIVLNGEQSDNNIITDNNNNTKVILTSANSSKAESNITSDIVEISKIENTNIKSTKSYAVVSVEEIDSSTESVTIDNTADCEPCKEVNIKETDVVLMEDSNLKEIENIDKIEDNEDTESVDDDGIYVVSKLNLKEKVEPKEKPTVVETSKEKHKEKIDDSKLKNVKPMRKPSGRVFRKKGGLLKKFGL